MKFRPTEFLNTLYRVSCYIKLYRKLFSVMRPLRKTCLLITVFLNAVEGIYRPLPFDESNFLSSYVSMVLIDTHLLPWKVSFQYWMAC